ncbi:MAG: sulfotransferase family protein [Gammaproteobacteria bacterium]|nr:MAG: sulfotransferase family protein [Gammaproteobacteria bacterium]
MQLTEKALFNIVVTSLDKQDFKKAIAACRQLNSEFPDYFEGWYIAGEIHRKFNKPKAGLFSTEHALAIRPGEPRVTLQRIECLIAEEMVDQARQLLLQLAQSNLQNPQIHPDILDRTAIILATENLHEEALKQYQKALSLEPNIPALHYNLATALRFLGKLSEAEQSLDKCLALNPFDFEAQAMRSSLRKQTQESNHTDVLESVLADKKLPDQGKVNIAYALAKENDDLDNFELSFRYLKQGATARRSQMSYDVQADLKINQGISRCYQKSIFEDLNSEKSSGHDSYEPIFIIGLPRTGTTLVERILSSHTDVFAAGELDNFSRKLSEIVLQQSSASKLSTEQLVESSRTINFEELGLRYLSSTRPATGHTKHFIDKLPFNYLYAGVIHLALPKAKIINITRHPMAACYAIYKQLFRDVYPYSYDLNDLAQYYIAYHQLIKHWKKVMPGVMYDLSYESVVADISTETKALLNYCELPWQEQCLRFYDNKDASTTASASQIRQPIYRGSLNRWRRYSQQLQPLQNILEQAGICCD